MKNYSSGLLLISDKRLKQILAFILIILPLILPVTLKASKEQLNKNNGRITGFIDDVLLNDTATGQITLKVIETAGTNLIKYVGWSRGEDFLENKLKIGNTHTFEVSNDGYFRINDFKIRKKNTIRKIDYLMLYDANKKLLGHIAYEYYPKKEVRYIRQLILFLHNSKPECFDQQMQMHFPYTKENPFYAGLFGGKWTYFRKGEYPVTMLIPPDYKENNKEKWIGNKFPQSLTKSPVLFIHGLTGKYSVYDKAKAENNETSYWWMQTKYLNEHNLFDGWQVYYPFDANIDFIAKWLKADIDYLNKLYGKELNLVAHSMGGLATMELITSDYFNAKGKLNKVFLSEPPLHGSLGGNKQYRTGRGRFFELFGFDREAPSIKDLSFGSDFYYNLHNRKWPSLDDDNFISDDYFVLIGTTQDNYKLPELVHSESPGQSDGIVSMSSASLLNHKIRFATFNGNHDDGRGCWSKFDFDNQDKFLANLIIEYFTKNIKNFETYLVRNEIIDAYVQMNTNRLLVKKKREGVKLEQGIFNIRILKNQRYDWKKELENWDELIVLKNKIKKTLVLSPRLSSAKRDEKFIESNGLSQIIKLYPDIEGFMSRNPFVSEEYLSYYFTKKPSQTEHCVSDMNEGDYKALIYIPGKKFSIYLGSFKFKHLRAALVDFNLSKYESPFFAMDKLSFFANYIPAAKELKDNTFVPDTTVNITENTNRVVFQVSCPDAFKKNIKMRLHLKNPNGLSVNSKISSVKWKEDKYAGSAYYIIEKPTPGKWKIAARASYKSSKRMYYTIGIYEEPDKQTNKSSSKKNKKGVTKDKKNSKIKSIFNKLIDSD